MDFHLFLMSYAMCNLTIDLNTKPSTGPNSHSIHPIPHCKEQTHLGATSRSRVRKFLSFYLHMIRALLLSMCESAVAWLLASK